MTAPADALAITLAGEVGDLLRRQKKRLVTVESCTGGLIASRITDVPGSSDYFTAGLVVYANAAKTALAGVPESLLAEHGAVSEAVARAMAEGARSRTEADVAVATTGIAGPGGGSAAKPVGLVYVAVADEAGSVVGRHQFSGDRQAIKERAASAALGMLRDRLSGADPSF